MALPSQCTSREPMRGRAAAYKAATRPLLSHSASCGFTLSISCTTRFLRNICFCTSMTLEEVQIQTPTVSCTGQALVDVLESAKDNDTLTVGVYECAKVMNLDPDSVAFCVLAMDEQFEWDVALQIHFTLIQSFCFDNDISIVRVSDRQWLHDIVGREEDAHCLLITTPSEGKWDDPALEKLHVFCEESHAINDWLPEISLPER